MTNGAVLPDVTGPREAPPREPSTRSARSAAPSSSGDPGSLECRGASQLVLSDNAALIAAKIVSRSVWTGSFICLTVISSVARASRGPQARESGSSRLAIAATVSSGTSRSVCRIADSDTPETACGSSPDTDDASTRARSRHDLEDPEKARLSVDAFELDIRQEDEQESRQPLQPAESAISLHLDAERGYLAVLRGEVAWWTKTRQRVRRG